MKWISVVILVGILSGCAAYVTPAPVYYSERPVVVVREQPVIVVHAGYHHRGW